MEWFDGTFSTTMEKVEAEYPIKVTEDLRANADKSQIALINRFTKNDFRLDMAAPRMDKKDSNETFYHVFIGDDARYARNFFTAFLASGYGTKAKDVDLFRQESNRLFEYAYGEIPAGQANNQETLESMLPKQMKSDDVYILPLRVFKYPCPVCGNKTLQWRGMFDICDECGWEDDGTDNEDEETSPNGNDTIRTYRMKYMKLKQENPSYKWFSTKSN